MQSRRIAVVLALVLAGCTSDDSGGDSTATGAGTAAATAETVDPVADPPAVSSPSTAVSTPDTRESAVTTTSSPPADSTDPPETSTTDSPAPDLPAFDPRLLPPLPQPATLAGADPPSRAAELVAMTADDSADVSAGWLTAYAELAVPVIDQSGASTAADGDPIGPRWDIVWAIGTMSRGRTTISLSDAARVLGWDETSPADPAQLLSDVRAAAASADPAAQTFGMFVAGKSVANGGADPTDPAVVADQVWLDAATLQLVSWVIAADVVAATLDAEVVNKARTEGFGRSASTSRLDASAPCSELFGTADATSWINYVAGKLGGGTGIEGVGAMPGVVEAWVTKVNSKSLGEDAGKAAGARAAAMIGKINFASSLLSLIAEVNALTVGGSMEPQRLLRHRQNTDGDTAEIRVDISFSSATFNGNDAGFCMLSMLANVLGVGLSLPADGANLSGVEVLVTPGKNFPDRVYFADGGAPRRTTDSTGSFTIGVQGRARQNTLPESTPEFDDEFGLRYSAQVEEVTAQSLLNVFMDGLQLHNGGLGGAIDIVKTLHYDLGEHIYPFRDYGGDLRIDGESANLQWGATKCGGFTGTWEFTVNGARTFPTGGTATLDREPEPGAPVQAFTDEIHFQIVDPRTGYTENFQLTFYFDGSETTWGAPAGSPAMGIDEMFGGGGVPIEVGNFC